MASFTSSTSTAAGAKRRRRPDGRLLFNEDGSVSSMLRPLTCELSCLHRSDGSSLWKSGSTHVLAAVYGPVAPRIPSQEKGDEAVVSVVIKSGRHNPASTSTDRATTATNTANSTGMLEREWEQMLTCILSACIDTKAYARTVVEVVLQVIQDDGSVLAASLHAAVAALMDAGVAMTNLPVATTFLIMPSDSVVDDSSNKPLVLLDPSSEEERDPNNSVLLVVTENEDPNRILATHSMATANLSVPIILSCAQAAAKATPAVVTFWRLAMEQRVTRESQTLWSS
jgi:exosome complex component RRP46